MYCAILRCLHFTLWCYSIYIQVALSCMTRHESVAQLKIIFLKQNDGDKFSAETHCPIRVHLLPKRVFSMAGGFDNYFNKKEFSLEQGPRVNELKYDPCFPATSFFFTSQHSKVLLTFSYSSLYPLHKKSLSPCNELTSFSDKTPSRTVSRNKSLNCFEVCVSSFFNTMSRHA